MKVEKYMAEVVYLESFLPYDIIRKMQEYLEQGYFFDPIQSKQGKNGQYYSFTQGIKIIK